ncbi:hypothetical protein [Rhodoferax sp.]|jgi:hypothetical protein|uniref:hypothetical protein n=1 Tax=Rhodoferax sp. TaxID=50421 RepID=UPI002734101A|nr:hypothetical protein [Rhodoferax sp.]MDP3863741.1 hypothetical protein [Rhodoferax sp.]
MQTRRLTMTVSRLALAISIALAGTAALAVGQDTTDHAAHHPAGVSSAVKTVPAKTGAIKTTKGMGTNSIGKEKMDQMEGHMETMQALHQKFMAAKTPEERNVLMPEHMKAMEEAMRMMQGMSGMGMMGDMKSKPMPDKLPADMAARHQMMEKRMEMMQSMMQMMMDRLPGATEK